MNCSFCRKQTPKAVVSPGATICQPCVSNAVQEFAKAFNGRTDIKRDPRPNEGVGRFHADSAPPLMAA